MRKEVNFAEAAHVVFTTLILAVNFVSNTFWEWQPDECLKYQAVANGINLKLKVILCNRLPSLCNIRITFVPASEYPK